MKEKNETETETDNLHHVKDRQKEIQERQTISITRQTERNDREK